MTRAQRTNAVMVEIAKERERQVNVEGWTEAHDDAHGKGEMARAASCYALASAVMDPTAQEYHSPKYWPWDWKWWKQHNRRRNLVKAAALIVAELERLDRLAEQD